MSPSHAGCKITSKIPLDACVRDETSHIMTKMIRKLCVNSAIDACFCPVAYLKHGKAGVQTHMIKIMLI